MSSDASFSDSQYPISNISPPTSSPSDEIDSLPDSASSDDIDDEEDEEGISDAEKQWQESLQQMELLLTMVVIPYAGKYFGRKFAYWGECRLILCLMEQAADNGRTPAWARFMEWQHPNVEIVFTNKRSFKVAGAVEAAASL